MKRLANWSRIWFFVTALAGNIEPASLIRIHCQLCREWISQSIGYFFRGAREPQRATGFSEARGRARRLNDHGTTEVAGQFVRLLDDVASFPRRDGLDLLNIASTSIIELIGSGAANAALDDIAGLWP